MPAFDQLIVRRMIESIKTGELPYTLQDPQIIRSKGRPRGAGNRKQDRAKNTTQRNSSQFEYVEMKMEKERSKKRKAKTDLETREKRARIDQEPVVSDDENEDAEADNKSEDECDFLQPEDKYGHLLPKTYYEISSDIDFASYDNIANIKRDGFCGFRAIAYEIFGDQDKFMEVKFAMRDRLAEVKEAYRTSFPLFDVDVLERIVNFGIEAEKNSMAISITKPYSCGSLFWFLAPECAQLAACTFNRPVAI